MQVASLRVSSHGPAKLNPTICGPQKRLRTKNKVSEKGERKGNGERPVNVREEALAR